MKLTNKLAEDMKTLRQDIVKVYNEELCDKVERRALIALSSELALLKRDMANLQMRLGIEIMIGKL